MLPAIRFWPVPPGDYRLELAVYTLADCLVERWHHLLAGYELCGIEQMAVTLSGLISTACLLIGGLIGLLVIRSIIIKKRPVAKLEL